MCLIQYLSGKKINIQVEQSSQKQTVNDAAILSFVNHELINVPILIPYTEHS